MSKRLPRVSQSKTWKIQNSRTQNELSVQRWHVKGDKKFEILSSKPLQTSSDFRSEHWTNISIQQTFIKLLMYAKPCAEALEDIISDRPCFHGIYILIVWWVYDTYTNNCNLPDRCIWEMLSAVWERGTGRSRQRSLINQGDQWKLQGEGSIWIGLKRKGTL